MVRRGAARKAAVTETVAAAEVYTRLSDLLNRAGFGDARIVLTRNGKRIAAIIGMKDLERLQALDGA